MAADPKTMTPTPPDAKLIPVRTLTFLPGMNVQLPGKSLSSNSITGTAEPVPQQFWTVGFDPRVRSFRVAYYAPGTQVDRPPNSVTMVSESVVATWVPL